LRKPVPAVRTVLLAVGVMLLSAALLRAEEAAFNSRAAREMIIGYEKLQSGDKEDALEAMGRAVKLDPQSQYLKVMYAEVLFALGRYDEIIRTLKPLAGSRDSADIQALKLLAVSYQSAGKVEEAIDYYKKVVRRDSSEDWIARRLLEILNGQRRYQEMIPVYKALLDPESESYAFDLFQIGVLYYQIGGREPARDFVTRAIQADSSLAEAFSLLARLDELDSHWDSALENYLTFIELKPDKAQEVLGQVVAVALRAAYPAGEQSDSLQGARAWQALLERIEQRRAEGDSLNPVFQRVTAIAYEATGRIQEATALYGGILERNPSDRFTRRSLLRMLFAQERYKEMIPLYPPLLDPAEKTYARDLYQLGVLYLKEHDKDKAREFILKAVEADSSLAEGYQALGGIYELDGDWRRAQSCYIECLERNPGALPEVFDRLLTVSIKGQDLKTPTDLMESLIQEGDTTTATRERLGRLYFHAGEIEKASSLLEPLAQGGKLSDNGLYTLGFLYTRLDRLPEATEAFERVRASLPDFIPVYLALGRVYYTRKQYDQAAAMLSIGLEKAPAEAREERRELMFSLADVYHGKGDWAGTEKCLRKVLSDDPEFAPALNYLGYFYAEQGRNLEEAQRMVDRALKKEPGNGHYIDSLGWILFKMGRREAALKQIQSALSALGGHPEVYEHLGDIYLSLGQRDQALEAWNKGLEMDGQNAGLRAKVDSLKTGSQVREEKRQ
jgi:tetratricopeptide (TPR) repeat protein